MKKGKLFILAGSVCLVLILAMLPFMAACAKPAPAPAVAPTPAERAQWPSLITIGSKPPPSPTYVQAVAIAEMIKKRLGVETAVETYKGAAAILEKMAEGKVDILSDVDGRLIYVSEWGLEEYKGKPVSVATFWSVGERFALITVRKDSGIKKFEDLRGKRFMFDMTAAVVIWRPIDLMLEAYGMTRKDVIVQKYTASQECVDALKEKRTDAATWATTWGGTWFYELAVTGDVTCLSLPQEVARKVAAGERWMHYADFPMGGYPNQPEAHITTAFDAVIAGRTALPDSLTYWITKTIFDNFDEYVSYGGFLKDSRMPEGLKIERQTGPVHNGAIKYYRERGWWTPQHDKMQADFLADIAKSLGK